MTLRGPSEIMAEGRCFASNNNYYYYMQILSVYGYQIIHCIYCWTSSYRFPQYIQKLILS